MSNPSTPHDVPSVDNAGPQDPNDPALQGEGNYTAARRHRASVKKFVDSGQVDQAAHEAAPDSAAQASELEAAEAEGLAHAKR